MKRFRDQQRVNAFTLIELLVVIAIIAILAAMLLPGIHGTIPQWRALNSACFNNQKQLAVGFSVFATDNNDKFPWLFTTNGGTQALITDGQAASQFKALSDMPINTTAFHCPTDRSRPSATDFATLNNSNLSYFVNVDANLLSNPAQVILTGDRHLHASGQPVPAGLFAYTNNMVVGWTIELHNQSRPRPTGLLSFGDGHAEQVHDKQGQLAAKFTQQLLPIAHLLVP